MRMPMSETITVGLGECGYDIHVGGGLLARAGELLKPYISTGTPLFPWSLTAMFVLPQLLIALVGGWFNTRYRLTLRIERRPNEGLPD